MNSYVFTFDRDSQSIKDLIVVEGHTRDEVEQVFNKAKAENPESWTYEDLMNALAQTGWKYEVHSDIQGISF